jgi:hypothetical protein
VRVADPVRALRWWAGLAVVFFGIVPAVMVSMLVAQGKASWTVGLLLIGGIPLVLAALFYAVRGLRLSDPEQAAAVLRRSMALVAGADVLLLGGNALLGMATS